MVTIDHIAAKAGVSRSSVAKILRGHPGFNPRTCQRVQRIAQQLNYRANYLGKALAGGRSMTIGVLCAGLNVPITMNKIAAVGQAAMDAGYLPYMVSFLVDDAEQMLRAVQNLVDRRVDGIICHHTGAMPDRVGEALLALEQPVVFMDHSVPGARHSVCIRRETGVRQAAEHLAPLGHRSGVLFHTTSDEVNPRLRLQPAQQAFAKVGISLDAGERWLLRPQPGFKAEAYRITAQAMSQRQRPTLLVMNNDDCAQAAIAAVCDAGLRVPQDVSVLGFDDLPASQYLRPALTTIHQPRAEVGQAAFQMLHQLLQQPDADTPPQWLDCHLVVRQSTGPVAR